MSTQSICSTCGANYKYLNGRWKCPACGMYKEEELSPEEATLLYNAAQKLRLSNFAEAEEAYSDIIEKYPENANAYWGRLLSKYGIKYEEDFDGRKIPTCYATSIESIIDDNDYSKAIELADAENKTHFEIQASYIERVRLEWINKAQKEKPYDVFICYKDSDSERGIERTEDSVNAQEIYIHLIGQGYRVFFSRESLRDKVGEKYEPYIFNALSTAKVMLVYGSSAEYIKSTWLKNEWHRYYKKIVSGEKHQESLIVACKGFSPSELPTILSSRQCLDAKRMTFLSDLDKCIKRIIQESPEQVPSPSKKEETLFSGLHEHTYKTKVVKATCIAKGYTIHKCDCGYEYKDTYTPLVDHSFKLDERVDPTCTKDGYEKKTCKICGESITDKLFALGHQFKKWVETKHPDCTEDGESQRQCTRCGHIEKKVLVKTGHQYGSWTATDNETQTRYCTNCGHTQTRENTAYGNVYSTPSTHHSEASVASPWSMFWLCLIGGLFGTHKFIEKKIGAGLLYLFTGGLFYIGWIFDCVKYYKEAKGKTHSEGEEKIDSPFMVRGIFDNWLSYLKSFFTSETSRAQKMSRISGLLTWLSFALLIIPSNAVPVANTVSDTITSIGAVILAFTMFFGIATLIVRSEERKANKELDIVKQNPYCRVGLKITSYFLLFLAAAWFALAFVDYPNVHIPTLFLSIIVSMWALISSMYSHLPVQYQKIQFMNNSKPVNRKSLTIIGAILSFLLLSIAISLHSTGA